MHTHEEVAELIAAAAAMIARNHEGIAQTKLAIERAKSAKAAVDLMLRLSETTRSHGVTTTDNALQLAFLGRARGDSFNELLAGDFKVSRGLRWGALISVDTGREYPVEVSATSGGDIVETRRYAV